MSSKSGIYSSGDFYLFEECFDENRAYIRAKGLGNSEVKLVDKTISS